MELIKKQYSTIKKVAGPLIFVEGLEGLSFEELCTIKLSDGRTRLGQVLKLHGDSAVIQVLEGTTGIDIKNSTVTPSGEVAKVGLSEDVLGRVFSGMGSPIDGLSPILPTVRKNINGAPINPVARERPSEFIETGISAIDGLNTLVRGQKLPVFSTAGLPANKLVMQIVKNSRVPNDEDFFVVLGAMGLTSREAFYFTEELEASGMKHRTVSYINLASDPAVERLFTPRIALTTAEYLAFEKGCHVLVLLTDMTAYCEALREIAGAREEIPGRRGYPGYMYTDLATIYERAGIIKGRPGSVTIVPVITMPDGDITHPIPDLTGYITEGQIVLDKSMQRKHYYPPINVLPSLSRLMNHGIGKDKTTGDHREVSNDLYSSYAKGVDVRRLVTLVGEEGLTTLDRSYLEFARRFEEEFISQGTGRRTIKETLGLAKDILALLPK